jgi:hypothetical protein
MGIRLLDAVALYDVRERCLERISDIAHFITRSP